MSAVHYAIPEEAQAFAQKLLVGAGLPIEEAGLMAKCLVLADIRGVVCGLRASLAPLILTI